MKDEKQIDKDEEGGLMEVVMGVLGGIIIILGSYVGLIVEGLGGALTAEAASPCIDNLCVVMFITAIAAIIGGVAAMRKPQLAATLMVLSVSIIFISILITYFVGCTLTGGFIPISLGSTLAIPLLIISAYRCVKSGK